jgi:hypothetical protein
MHRYCCWMVSWMRWSCPHPRYQPAAISVDNTWNSKYSYMLLMMGEGVARNMYSRLEINKSKIVVSFWSSLIIYFTHLSAAIIARSPVLYQLSYSMSSVVIPTRFYIDRWLIWKSDRDSHVHRSIMPPNTGQSTKDSVNCTVGISKSSLHTTDHINFTIKIYLKITSQVSLLLHRAFWRFTNYYNIYLPALGTTCISTICCHTTGRINEVFYWSFEHFTYFSKELRVFPDDDR